MENLEKQYKEIAPKIYRYSMVKVGNKEMAEDITSETFLRLIDAKKENIENMNAFAFGIARNVVLETYRKQSKHIDMDDEFVQEFEVDKSEIEKVVVDEVLTQKVLDEMQEMDDQTQDIVTLKIWEDMKFSEIADVVGMKESATKLRFYRGVEKLKNSLGSDNKTILAGILAVGSFGQLLPTSAFLKTLFMFKTTTMIGKASSVAAANATTGSKFGLSSLVSFFSTNTAAQIGAIGIAGVTLIGGGAIIANNANKNSETPKDTEETVQQGSDNADNETNSNGQTSTYKSEKLGIQFEVPSHIEFKDVELNYYQDTEVLVKLKTTQSKASYMDSTIFFTNVNPTLLLLAGYGEASQDTRWGSFEILGESRIFEVRLAGEGLPSYEGCEEGAYWGTVIFSEEIKAGVYAYISFQVSDDCLKDGEATLDEAITAKIGEIESTFIPILESIEIIETQEEPEDRYIDSTLGISFIVPEGLEVESETYTYHRGDTYSLKVTQGEYEMRFIALNPEALYIAGYGAANKDTNWGEFDLLNKPTKFDLRIFGEGVPSDEAGCEMSFYQQDAYTANIVDNVHVYVELKVEDNCKQANEPDAPELMKSEVSEIRELFIELIESIELV